MRAKSASIWPVRRSNSISFAELGAVGQEVHVNLVGAELGATLADLGEVERRRAVGDASDGENLAAGAGAAAHEHVVGGGKRRALEQLVDRVHVAAARRTRPEMEPRRSLLAFAASRV